MGKWIWLSLLFIGYGCQQAPTKSLEETVNILGTRTVLVDTRTAFLFQSGHILGSVNLVSDDFLILTNPMTKKKVLDPDLVQTIERLARRGLNPNKKVILLAEKKSSEEIKKWTWLLKQLGFDDIQNETLAEFKKAHPNVRYAEPERATTWDLKLSSELQQEFILKKAPYCFVKWSDKKCSN